MKRRDWALWTVLVLAALNSVLSAKASEKKANPCVGKKTCGQCIGAGPQCGWCSAVIFTERNQDRCDLIVNLKTNGCPETNISSPPNVVNETENKPVQDGTSETDVVQLQPQAIHIKLRPNTPQTFNFTFRLAENYPVDLYYLMDLSNSMKDDKEKLAALGNKIADSMSNITKNFRLGFGSFVDKVVMPYVSTVPAKLTKPCDECEAPYSFKNQLSLDRDTDLFESSVRSAKVSGNLDAPEGGFDAIMQAIVCKNVIGWRDISRKLLVYSSDAGFHFAGDGKLGGIVKPNDGYCHLTDNKYTEAEHQDYPSVSQIATKIRERSINLIFAVTDDQFDVYGLLSSYIEGSEATILANDSSNIVTVIANNYKRITSKVQMKTQYAENITVKFQSSCKGDEVKETSTCDDLSIGDNVTFEVTISVDHCPSEVSQRTRTISLYPVGLAERLSIEVELICECDCEKEDQEVRNSSLCNSMGTYECGHCTCDPGRYGKQCECDGSQSTSAESMARCIEPNATSICSGRGECICGVCECFSRRSKSTQKYSGTYCECDDFSCTYENHTLCAGHGVCNCGQCICDEGYTGEACNCPTSTLTCKTKSGDICNNAGLCECGQCICNATGKKRGPTCEECPTCEGKCSENKNCALCVAFQSGPLTPEQCQEQCGHVTTVPTLDTNDENTTVNVCQFKDDEDDCRFFFTYEYVTHNEVTVQVQEDKECPEAVNITYVVLGTIGGIILIGLILLFIWKLFTSIHDRREFANFEKETLCAKWDTTENPIYEQATSTFQNPTYDK